MYAIRECIPRRVGAARVGPVKSAPTELSARRTQTRERLIEAALGVFAEKGVLAATVEEICEAAGFTRGAFYSNFDSKDSLCIAVLDRQAEETLVATRRAVASLPDQAHLRGASTEELVTRAVEVFMHSERADRAWVLGSSELRLYAARSPRIAAAYRERHHRAATVFVALLQGTAAELGYELVVPGTHAVTVLQAVMMHGAVEALIEGEDVSMTVRSAQLVAVLRSMLRQAGSRPA